jgi:septal ring factor EnvC (AmiA/AmiB activator)
MRTLASIFLAVMLASSSFLSLGFLQPATAVHAASSGDLQAQRDQLAADAKKKQALAAAEASQAKQLAAQIDAAGNQIDELQTNIASTDDQIGTTQDQMDQQSQQLAGLESDQRKSEDRQSALVKEIYIRAISMPDELVLLTNQPVSDRERSQAQYDALKKSVAKIIEITNEKKIAVQKSQDDLKKHSDELAQLRNQQNEQKIGLATFQSIQADAKANHDAATQKYTAEAQADNLKIAKIDQQISAAFAGAITAFGKGSTGVHVEKGTIIGHRGSTGYSTGPHVHFEVRIGNTPVDPGPFVANGKLIWPVSSFVITQGFGYTDYAQGGAYGGSPHTGYDLAGDYGTPVVASCSGSIILNQYYGGYGNAVGMHCDMDGNINVLDGHMTGN